MHCIHWSYLSPKDSSQQYSVPFIFKFFVVGETFERFFCEEYCVSHVKDSLHEINFDTITMQTLHFRM